MPQAHAARGVGGGAELEAARGEALAPLERAGGENPYTVHHEIQQTMSDLVGIIRREDEIKTALGELEKLRERAEKVSAPGGRAYNPGWHLALDLRNILLIARVRGAGRPGAAGDAAAATPGTTTRACRRNGGRST